MIRDLLSDIFSRYSTFTDRIIALFLLLILVGLIGAVGMMVYGVVDSTSASPTKTTVAKVENKRTISAYTTTTFITTGKTFVPITTYHPESYELQFKIEGEVVSPSVDKDFFDNVSVGNEIEVSYGYTKISHSIETFTIKLL